MSAGTQAARSFAITLKAIYAHLDCTDLARSSDWIARLFGRPADAQPMAGLHEWHHGDGAGLQLFEDAEKAGMGTLTLIVDGLRAEHARLEEAGLAPGAVDAGDTVSLVRLRDPDGNLVVLAQPGRV